MIARLTETDVETLSPEDADALFVYAMLRAQPIRQAVQQWIVSLG